MTTMGLPSRFLCARRMSAPTGLDRQPFEHLADALQPFDARVPERQLGVAGDHSHHSVPLRPIVTVRFGGALEVLNTSQAHELLSLDQLDHAGRVAWATERDPEVQFVAQWRLGRG